MPGNRRTFIQFCASMACAFGAAPAMPVSDATVQRFQRVRLDLGEKPLRPGDLKTRTNYLFFYPYVTTPCFLIDLGQPMSSPYSLATENGDSYEWPGGCGPERSIVSFSAICAHKLSHPTRQINFIRFREQMPDAYGNVEDNVIFCCSERSMYDPGAGARVIDGPAPQPLATVMLEYDESENSFYATGMLGGTLFEQFFTRFSDRLKLEWKTDNIREATTETATVIPLEEFSAKQKQC